MQVESHVTDYNDGTLLLNLPIVTFHEFSKDFLLETVAGEGYRHLGLQR